MKLSACAVRQLPPQPCLEGHELQELPWEQAVCPASCCGRRNVGSSCVGLAQEVSGASRTSCYQSSKAVVEAATGA